MREILFRGKRKDNGEWVYGYYGEFHNRPIVDEPNSCQIFEPHENASKLFNSMIGGIWHIVDRKTVGQYTELNDENDKPIYEGDIITCVNKSRHSGYPIGKKMYGFIAYGDNYGFWFCKNNFQHYIDWSWADNIEVIGNIYDNPELLGGAK